jgi:nitroreductase
MTLSLKNNRAVYSGECLHCGHCVAICPTKAVSIPEYDMDDVRELRDMDSTLSTSALFDAIRSRRSIRHYLDRKIRPETLETLIQAGRYTATAVNSQGCRFIVVQEGLASLKRMVWKDVESAVASGVEEAKPLQRLVKLRQEKGIDYLFRNAPAVLYIASNNVWDAGLAAQNMELIAGTQGLGVLYNGFLVRSTRLSPDAKKWLQLAEKPLAASMLVGYPSVEYLRTAPRKKADAIWL